MSTVNKLFNSDIVNNIYKKHGRITYTTRIKPDCGIYIETISTKLGQDILELNNKTFSNGNQLRTLTEKIPSKNLLKRMQLMLNPDNDIIALKSNFKNIETQEALSQKNFTNLLKELMQH